MDKTTEKSSKTNSIRTKILFALSLVIISAVVLVSVEIVLRILKIPYSAHLHSPENAVARFDKDLGWAYLPGLSKTVGWTYRKDLSAIDRNSPVPKPVYTDSSGIRVRHPNAVLSKTKPTILLVGCSYTMGHGLSYEEAFAGRLEDLIGDRFQIVNLGVQAYGTDQALLALRKFSSKFNTKMVIYTFVENHIVRNGNHDRRLLTPWAKMLGTKPLYQLDSKGNLYLARLASLFKDYTNSWLLDLIKMRLGYKLGLFPPYPVKLTEALIVEMKRYCSEQGIEFVMLNWRWNENDYAFRTDLGVHVLDTLARAPKNWEAMQLTPEDAHPGPEAGKHAANLLRDYIAKKYSLAVDSR